MDRLAHDARIALRGLRRAPTFTATAALVLGLSIGMAAAMWTVFDTVLVRRIPASDPDRVVVLHARDRAAADVAFQPRELDALRRGSRTMREIATYAHWDTRTLPMADGDQPVVLNGAQVGSNFFTLLGARPVLGRLLRPEDDSLSHVMVLSYGAWQRQFGGDIGVVGHHLRETTLNATFTIVGVAPPGLDYPAHADYWIVPPFTQWVDVIARLAPGATPAAARAEFQAAAEEIYRAGAAPGTIGTADVHTLPTAIVGDVRPTLVVLTAAVGLLLLIACVNVGNLLLLRAGARARELTVRRAVGATQLDILRLLGLESALLGLGGGALGLLAAQGALRALIAAAPRQLPRIDALRVASTPLGVAAALAGAAVVVFGVVPAFSALRFDLRSRGATRERRRTRQLLVSAQVALALILLAGAGLLAHSLERLETLDLGYQAPHLSLLQLSWPVERYSSMDKLFALYDQLAPRLSAIPGVTAVTPIEIPPFAGAGTFSGVWQYADQSMAQAMQSPQVPYDIGGPAYFQTLGIPIVRGRSFLDSDRENAPPVAIVSASLARRYWPGADPIGQRIRFADTSDAWRTVVGVAGDTHYRALREAIPMVYLPYRQGWWYGHIAIRTTAQASSVLPALRRALAETDPNVTLFRYRTMQQLIDEPMAQPRLSALLLTGFSLVALLLAAIGLYGIMASAVRDETREIGIRMALGATPNAVRRDVLTRALIVAGSGAAVGLAGALLTSRVITSLLFDVTPTDPLALAGAVATLLGVATLAAYVPARRATRIDPASALRTD